MNTLDICMVICVSFFFMFLFVIGIKDTNKDKYKRYKKVTTNDIMARLDEIKVIMYSILMAKKKV